MSLGLLLMLAIAAAALAAVLARTYDAQLQGVASSRLREDLPLFRNQLEELRGRSLHLTELAAGNPDIIAGAQAHDTAALDRVVGSLRTQLAPSAQFLTVVDDKGQIIATDPFTNLDLAGDAPVKAALQGRASLNLLNSPNTAFWVRAAYPNLSIETAWPVKSGSKTIGAVVVINVIGDGMVDTLLTGSQLQAAIATPQRGLPAASTPLRQLSQQQKLPNWLDALDRKSEGFVQPVTGGGSYYFLQTAFPSQPQQLRLLLGIPSTQLAAEATGLRRQLFGVALIAFLALGGIGFLLLRWALLPLRQLRRGARRVREGGAEIELAKTAPPDIREVAAALSELAGDLAAAVEAERSQRNHVGAIIDSMAEGVVVSDASRRVTLVNPVAKRLLGINGSGGTTAVLPLQAGELPGNSSVIKSRSAPIIGEDGQTSGYVTVLHDASEEAELDRLKSEFVGVVSHELRTPLTSIKGSVELLLDADTGELNPTQRRFLSTIRRSSDRLIDLVNDLLDLSRLEAGRVQLDAHPVDARHLVEDTVNNLANLFAAKKQQVRTTCEADLPPILADRQRLQQVLVNLLGNASKYTPEGGEIHVTARRARESELVEIDVTDTGPGLTPDEQRRVFEKFYRAGDGLTQQQTGSGLGLTIARSLIELHGGTLTVESEPGRGSTFRIALPTYTEED
ncbi:MAG TPA: ATP-binding protein [Chloroflexota bacterium]|nr:ATP-binding protein [Chloroflexota bacterium]